MIFLFEQADGFLTEQKPMHPNIMSLAVRRVLMPGL